MFLVGVVIYILFLFFPPPVTITKPFSEFHLGMMVLSVIFFGLIFNKRGSFWDTLSLTFVLILFAISLIYKWQTAHYGGQLLGGYFPLSDAGDYHAGAQLLITGNHVTPFSGRRPFFAGFLAVILSLTGSNLHISLGGIVALTAISIYLTAREIQAASNSFGAAVYLMLCYWYYFPFAGTLMTESLGLILGSLALAFLLKATRGGLNLKYFCYGLFSLTIALNVRPGAFLILPALMIWIGLLFYKSGRTKYVLLVLTFIVALGMIANVALNKMIGNPEITTYSKYSEFLYGLVTGGQGWRAMYIDHPGMTESEIFKLSIEIFKKDPGLLFKGIAKSFSDYFAPVNGAFSFLRLVYVQNNIPDRILWVLLGTGLLTALIKYKQEKYGLILAGFAGIFLSLTFVPPTEADDMRIYAVTMPFVFYIISTGAVVPVSFLEKFLVSPRREEEIGAPPGILNPLTFGILLTCLIGPPLWMMVGHSPKFETPPACPSGQENIYFHVGNQSSILLMQDNDIAESYMPNIRTSDFRNGVISGPIYTFLPFLDRELLSLNAGQIINLVTYVYPQGANLGGGQYGYLITTGGVLPSGFHIGCGTRTKDGQIEVPWFYYMNNIENQAKASSLAHAPVLIGLVRIFYGLSLLFVVVMAVMDVAAFRLMPWWKRLLLFGNIALIILGVLVYLHSNALFPLSWQRVHLEVENATFVDGYAYQVPLGVSWMNQKSVRQPPVSVYEDGVPLKYPNAKIYAVKHLGQGRFLVQSGYLYISASDNGDPRINGRNYEIEWPTPVRARYQFVLYSLALIAIIIHIKYFTTMEKQADNIQPSRP